MLVVRKAVRVDKIGIDRACFFRSFVHQGRKILYCFPNVQSERSRRVISRAKHQSVEQFLYGQFFPFSEVYARSFYTDRIFVNGNDILHIGVFYHANRRKNLCGAGGIHFFIRIFFKQYAPRTYFENDFRIHGIRRGGNVFTHRSDSKANECAQS